jgi:CHAD domain-containing protein
MILSISAKDEQLSPMSDTSKIRQFLEVSMVGSLPNLVYLDRVIAVADPTKDEFDTTYFDTADLRLARRSVTLVRVNGGDDAAWWLDQPDAHGRSTVIRQPLGRSTRVVPAALARQLRVVTRHETLRRVATVHTTSVRVELLNETGDLLAVVTDNVRRAQPFGGRRATCVWREVGAAVVLADGSLLDAVRNRLDAAGLHPRAPQPVLQRVLPNRVELRPATSLRPDATSGDVLVAFLREQIDQLIREDPRARRDEPDSVHRMRVATRRLRSALATYRPLLDRSRTDPVRDELAWLGAVLGAPRDAEVVRDRLQGRVSLLAPELVYGPVIDRIERETASKHEAAHAELVRALDGDRYLLLLDALDDLVIRAPLLDTANRPAGAGLRQLVRQACRRVDVMAARADKSRDPQQRAVLLHDVRRAAKRARYAAESVAPVFGGAAVRLAKAMERIQEVLGDYQDSVTAQPVIADIAAAARASDEDGFTFGLLYGLEQRSGDLALARYPKARKTAQSKVVRRWLG